MSKLFKNRIFQIVILVFLILSIPVGIYLIRQQQLLKSRAAAITGKATLALSPNSKIDAIVNNEFSVDLILDVPTTSQVSISAVDITVEYDDKLYMTDFTGVSSRFNKILMPTSSLNSWSNFEDQRSFRYVAADTQSTTAIFGTIKLGTMRFKFTEPGANVFIRFNQEKSRLTSRATPNAWDFLQPTLTSGTYSTVGASPSPSPSPGSSPSPSPSIRPRVRGDASQPYNYCVDGSDFQEWLAEYQGHSRRRSDDGLFPRADWAKPNENPDGSVQPDGIVDDLYDLGAYYEGIRDNPCRQ